MHSINMEICIKYECFNIHISGIININKRKENAYNYYMKNI